MVAKSDENALHVRSRLGMREDKLLQVFMTMLNDGFRSLIHVVTRLKEPIVQRSKQLDIALVGLSQHITQGLEWLLSYQRHHRSVDGIVHDRLLCVVGKLAPVASRLQFWEYARLP
jgi:hypothetical protein